MVCLRPAGGGLSTDRIKEQLQEAAQLYTRGQTQAAATICRAILRQAPEEPEAMFMLGIAAQEVGNKDLAFLCYEGALRIRPDFAQAWFNRAVLLYKLGDRANAQQSTRMALDVAPDLAGAWDLLGQILRDNRLYRDAAHCHLRAITLQPENASFHSNYALVLLAMGDRTGAHRMLLQADALDPDHPSIMLGNMLKGLGYPEQAADLFARIRAASPSNAEAAASEAMARLQMGDMAQGWELWEKRPDFEKALHHLPLWQGHPVGRLLLYEDQGLGDAIHFARYIPLLDERARRITLRARHPLRQLYMENFADIEIIGENVPLPPIDARCRLSSLPYLFATTLNTIPSAPYLKATNARRALWRARLSSVTVPRIGLVWAGNGAFHNNASRSFTFDTFAPLLDHGAAHFVSLQKGHEENNTAMKASGIFDAAPMLEDFADTAALISELDLVITVDTAVAHLAGALGKPVFILLAFDSDWRWLIGRQDSPWYPSARLFRQKKPGDWRAPIKDISLALDRWMSGDLSALRPAPWNGESLRQNPDALPLPA